MPGMAKAALLDLKASTKRLSRLLTKPSGSIRSLPQPGMARGALSLTWATTPRQSKLVMRLSG